MSDLSALLLLALVVLYVILKFLNVVEPARAPKLFFRRAGRGDRLVNQIVNLCPILQQRYVPPLLWGKNGHLHTFVFSKLSPKIECKATRQHSVKLEDNSTVIFDIFEPCPDEKSELTGDYTIVVVPGIANDSSGAYVLLLCKYVTKLGCRVVVLNHLGVLPGVKLTSKRIFTYGSTTELDAMVRYTVDNYPNTKLLGVGFSLGGNILVKYLGENPEHQRNFICAISLCQGYDILKACPALEEWDGLRRGYNWLITQKVKSVIKRHAQELLGGCSSTPYQEFKRNKVLMATSLKEIDEHFGRKMAGYQSVDDYYKYSSSSYYIDKVEIPMLLVNSQDDPLVPEKLLETPKKYVNRPNNKALFVLSQFGGHLGFYEGGLFRRATQTWLNKVILQYINAVLTIEEKSIS